MGKPRLPENSSVLIILLILVRISSAIYNLIYDCDETYNYWEVGHYLTFKNGYLTWEYSPQFALRSYFYLWTYIWPSYFISFLTSNEVILFYFTRLTIACFGIFCELYFCIGLSRCAGSSVGRYCMTFLLMSSGMYFASTAFLPNTLSMHLTMITFGAWFCDQYQMTIFAAGLSILIGWPYVAIIYIPIAMIMLLSRRKQLYFILFTLVYGTMILVPMILVDSYYYGKLAIAPLNSVLYNVFNPKAGPELYGVESYSFYIVNLMLNFNLVLLASMFSLPMLILSKIFVTTRKHKMLETSHWICISSLLLWLLIFSMQPHKEERFMYPIYPLICASAASTIKLIEQFVVGAKQRNSSPIFKTIVFIYCLCFLSLSLSRVVSLHRGFHPSFTVLSDLKMFDRDGIEPIINQPDKYINVCYGKEWYRYPTSYFLPSKRYRTRFIESEFRGQLPKLYDINDRTWTINQDFNNMNKEESSRYVKASECHYLIDSSQSDTSKREPDYSKDSDSWQILSSYRMLDLKNSPVVIRSFYLPFISEKRNSYVNFQLLRNKNLFKNTMI